MYPETGTRLEYQGKIFVVLQVIPKAGYMVVPADSTCPAPVFFIPYGTIIKDE